jgi:hypothetical protein
MLSLVHGWARLRSHYEVPSNVLRYGLASTLTYFFLTKPW